MQRFHTVIVGAGASGLVAAISGARAGNSVVLCERLPSFGKKLLACGGGRCNFLNEKLDESFYNLEAQQLVKSIFSRFGQQEILSFFQELGLYYYSEKKRIFPVTNQAVSVLKVLEIELKKFPLTVELGFEVKDVSADNAGFSITSSTGKKIVGENLVLAGGGKSYPALGSDGSCYKFCHKFGHRIIEPVPSAVPLESADKVCHFLQGQKIFAGVQSLIDGKISPRSDGELLFTKYGLSGTAVLDISRDVSIALNRYSGRQVAVLVDLVPFLEEPVLQREISRRIKHNFISENLLCGILPNKFGLALAKLLNSRDPQKITLALKHQEFKVLRTRGWNESEFTSGGIDTTQVNLKTLESSLKKRMFFCGEILDVEGKRGGYNLAWAFSSGFIAGLTGR